MYNANEKDASKTREYATCMFVSHDNFGHIENDNYRRYAGKISRDTLLKQKEKTLCITMC